MAVDCNNFLRTDGARVRGFFWTYCTNNDSFVVFWMRYAKSGAGGFTLRARLVSLVAKF